MADESPYASIMQSIRAKYPPLQRHSFSVVDAPQDNPDAYSEFYPSYESENPQPGQNTIETYSKLRNDPNKADLIAGETLHLLGGTNPQGVPNDPTFRSLKDNFLGTFSPEQTAREQSHHQDPANRQWTQGRPFKQYMDQSRSDAYIRAFMFPKANPGWERMFNENQKASLGQIRNYLTTYPGTIPPEEGYGSIYNRGNK